MEVKPVGKPQIFKGYKNILKTAWKKGRLKTVVKGLYGDILTINNLSLEHIRPHSKGGKTVTRNLALASKNKNELRGCSPLKYFLTREKAEEYLAQFKDIKISGFNGNKYIEMLRKTFKELL